MRSWPPGITVLLSLRVSTRPPDAQHPYGHRRVGTLVGLVVGGALAAAAIMISWRALVALSTGRFDPIQGGPVALCVAIASVPLKEWLYRRTMRVGRRTGDLALKANAWHHRTDACVSVAAAAGLAGATFGGAEWAFLDSATALVLAAFLIVVAARIMAQAATELIDQAPSEATQAAIKQIVADTPGVRSFHALRARQIGGRVAVDVHVQVESDLTVRQGHDIAAAVKHSILTNDKQVMDVMVHIEPAEEVNDGD
ncbi:MAG: cation diffusion facilitator family transporter [Planctomycetota bacterium]|jgi:cation diffusion facilitator family transporter